MIFNSFIYSCRLLGYVNHTLSVFDTSSFAPINAPKSPYRNVSECRYPDYRSAPGTTHQYELTYLYWIILAARLGFVLLFEVKILIANARVDALC